LLSLDALDLQISDDSGGQESANSSPVLVMQPNDGTEATLPDAETDCQN
jgi:hypothetical protein